MTRPAPSPGEPRRTLTRRELLVRGAATLGAVALSPWVSVVPGCRASRQEPGRSPGPDAAPGPLAAPRDFPLLDVSGEPFVIGEAIGKRFATEIHAVFQRRRGWFDGLARFARNEGRAAFEAMVEAARKHAPEVVDEVQGMADGAGVPLQDLLVLNARCELEAAQAAPGACPGCSTIVVPAADKLLVAHNEDGDLAWRDLMFLARVQPPSGVKFLAVCYAGIVAGNAPAINDRGLVMTTNFIGTVAWRPGVPRYFLDRQALEAHDPDDALARALRPERGYGFHHILAARQHGRLRALSVEATPTRSQVRELSSVYVHTNHLVLDELAGEPQDEANVRRSSIPRYETLTAALAKVADPAALRVDDLVRLLSSHEGAPYSPCRHPAGEVRGQTLACAVFDVPRRRMRLYAGNPCSAGAAEYAAPDPEALA